jgi:hypothetical protein
VLDDLAEQHVDAFVADAAGLGHVVGHDGFAEWSASWRGPIGYEMGRSEQLQD